MLFNKLSNHQKDMISNYINMYAGCPGGQHEATLEYILRYWNEAKSDYLWDLMGHNFILEKKIDYTKNITLMTENISDILKAEGHLFEIEYLNRVLRPLRSSINWFGGPRNDSEQYKVNLYYALEKLIDPVTLAANFYDGVSLKILNPKDEKHPIPLNQGCKVARILGKIADAYDLEGYEDFRLAHSRALNDKKISGTLCLSIHPMDYMTMSDNDSGWDSCMGWQSDGGFRQGTVEMMNSPMVVVGYLKAKDDMFIDHNHKWNNKRWRCLFLVTADFITSIMAYPYAHEELTVACVDWLRDLAKENLGWKYDGERPYIYKSVGIDVVYSDGKINIITKDDWHDHIGLTLNGKDVTKEEIFNYIKENPDTCDAKIARFYFETYVMYNDFGRTDHYAYFNIANILTDYAIKCGKSNVFYGSTQNYVYYSGKSECMNCGDIDVDFSDESMLCCTSCDDYVTCESCGERIPRDNAYNIDNVFYCEDCYCENFSECEVCGIEQHNEDLEVINFIPKCIYDALKEKGLPKGYGGRRWLNDQIAYTVTVCEDCAEKFSKVIGYERIASDYKLYMPYDEEILEKIAHDRVAFPLLDRIKEGRESIQEDLSEEAICENLGSTFQRTRPRFLKIF